MWHEIAYWLGLTDTTKPPYAWWSGVAASIPDLAILGAAAAWWSRRKCRICYRVAQNPVKGTAWATCHRHLSRALHAQLRERYAADWPAQFEMLSRPEQPEPPAGE